MKLFIISDLHGSATAVEKVLEKFNQSNADYLIILGDFLYHGPRNALTDGYNPAIVVQRLNEYKDKIIAIRGNCDAYVDEMVLDFKFKDFNNIGKYYFTHGHFYNNHVLPDIPKKSILFYGHTHIPAIEENDGILCVNPGSCAMSKQGPNSYAIVDDNITIYDFDENILLKH